MAKKPIKNYTKRSKGTRDKQYSREIKTTSNILFGNRISLEQDLATNYQMLYSQYPVYIHNHVRNFAIAADNTNVLLDALKEQVKTAWQKDAKALKKLIKTREEDFFLRLSGATGQKFTRTNFGSKFTDFVTSFSATLDYDLTKIKAAINDKTQYTKGTKSLDQLRGLANEYNNLFLYVQEIQKHGIVDETLIEYLEKHIKSIQKFINKYAKSSGTKTEFAKNDWIQNVLKDLSITKLNTNTIPRIIEGQFGVTLQVFLNSFTKSMDRYVVNQIGGKNNKKGSSGDIELKDGEQFSISFSIKSKQEQQVKERQLNSFFDINDYLLTDPNWKANNIYKLYGTNNLTNTFYYIIMNYVYLNMKEPDILNSINEIILLSNLNEKIFGYNKTGQKNEPLDELIQSLPIGIIIGANSNNSNVKVVFMSDFLNQLLDQIGSTDFNINSLGQVHIFASGNYQPLSKNNELWKEKLNILKAYPNEISYQFIKSKLENLERINTQLRDEIKVQVQYKIRSK